MRATLAAIAFGIGLIVASPVLMAGGPAIQVLAPWARATPGGAANGAAYLTLVNNGATDDRLLGISTPAAAMAEVHETENDNGVMKMRPVPSIELKPGTKTVFRPGGYHIMLMELKAPLVAGQRFPMTLTFEKAGKIEIMVPVNRMGASEPHAMGNMKM